MEFERVYVPLVPVPWGEFVSEEVEPGGMVEETVVVCDGTLPDLIQLGHDLYVNVHVEQNEPVNELPEWISTRSSFRSSVCRDVVHVVTVRVCEEVSPVGESL